MKRNYYEKYELVPQAKISPSKSHENQKEEHSPGFGVDFFQRISSFGTDEALILALIFALLTDDNPDFITIIALGFILLS